METIKGNTLINKFMNKKINPVDYAAIIHQNNGYYHLDWNWLMPVVIKINKLNILEMDEECGKLKMDVKGSLYGIGKDTQMNDVWKSLVNFLEKYLEYEKTTK